MEILSSAAAFLKRRNMRFFYKIADICVKGETPYELILQEESIPFLLADKEEDCCDVEVVFNRLNCMQRSTDTGIWKMNRLYYKKDGGDVVCFYPAQRDLPYACVFYSKGEIRIDYAEASIPDMNYSHNLIDLFSLEMLLLNYHGIIVHSSFIRWKNKGVLFTAPSGTGKSTQADLWVKYEQAECLNGDRTGLRKVDGEWISYGLPYAGSSGIYRNASSPLFAIVVLRQGKNNTISRMKSSDAFRALYPETLIHHWDTAFVSAAVSFISELVTEVPVYLLACRPDREAVDILRDELIKEGISL